MKRTPKSQILDSLKVWNLVNYKSEFKNENNPNDEIQKEFDNISDESSVEDVGNTEKAHI